MNKWLLSLPLLFLLTTLSAQAGRFYLPHYTQSAGRMANAVIAV